MALYLGSRAVREVLVTMQDILPGVLVDIAAELNDGILVPAIDLWHDYRRAVPVASNASLEVYDTSGEVTWFDLATPDAYRSVSSEISLVVRVVHMNRVQASTGVMAERTRRYAAGVMRVLRAYPQLKTGVAAVVSIARYQTDTVEWVDAETRKSADAVIVPISVRLDEQAAGEGVPGGDPGGFPDYTFDVT